MHSFNPFLSNIHAHSYSDECILPKDTLARKLDQKGSKRPTFQMVDDLHYLLSHSHPHISSCNQLHSSLTHKLSEPPMRVISVFEVSTFRDKVLKIVRFSRQAGTGSPPWELWRSLVSPCKKLLGVDLLWGRGRACTVIRPVAMHRLSPRPQSTHTVMGKTQAGAHGAPQVDNLSRPACTPWGRKDGVLRRRRSPWSQQCVDAEPHHPGKFLVSYGKQIPGEVLGLISQPVGTVFSPCGNTS